MRSGGRKGEEPCIHGVTGATPVRDRQRYHREGFNEQKDPAGAINKHESLETRRGGGQMIFISHPLATHVSVSLKQ